MSAANVQSVVHRNSAGAELRACSHCGEWHTKPGPDDEHGPGFRSHSQWKGFSGVRHCGSCRDRHKHTGGVFVSGTALPFVVPDLSQPLGPGVSVGAVQHGQHAGTGGAAGAVHHGSAVVSGGRGSTDAHAGGRGASVGRGSGVPWGIAGRAGRGGVGGFSGNALVSPILIPATGTCASGGAGQFGWGGVAGPLGGGRAAPTHPMVAGRVGVGVAGGYPLGGCVPTMSATTSMLPRGVSQFGAGPVVGGMSRGFGIGTDPISSGWVGGGWRTGGVRGLPPRCRCRESTI